MSQAAGDPASTGHAIALDHVGVAGHDLAALAGEFAALGFLLTPPARHAGGRTGNRCVMLRHGYIELLATVDGGHSATLEKFLARYAGSHILALAVTDETAALQRLHRAGMADAATALAERAIDDADPSSPHARFALVTTPDPPEGRIHLVHHLTPETLWQPRFLAHPNHAVRLDEVVLVTAQPAEPAARLSRLAGRPVVPDAAGGYRLDLASGRVRVLPVSALDAVFPGAAPPALPWFAGVTLRTDDGNVAVCTWLRDRGVAYRMADAAVQVQAGGVTLRFLPG